MISKISGQLLSKQQERFFFNSENILRYIFLCIHNRKLSWYISLLKRCLKVFNVLSVFQSSEIKFTSTYRLWRGSQAKFATTDSFGTNRADVSVTYTIKCVPTCPRWPALPLPCQTLSLTNRCRATVRAVTLLPKHFNELTWTHVSRHVVPRVWDVADTITMRVHMESAGCQICRKLRRVKISRVLHLT